MADEVSLSGVALPGDPVVPLEAAPMQYVDVRSPLILNDLSHYGDYWSTMPRQLSTQTRTLVVGTGLFCAGIAADTFTASKLRVCSGTAAAGTGTFRASLYTGTSLSSLSLRASMSPFSSVAAATVYEVALSSAIAITPGLIVCMGFLTTGFSTAPTFQAAPQGGGPAPLISPTSGRWCATGASGSTALPTTNFSMANYTAHGNPMWCALAP